MLPPFAFSVDLFVFSNFFFVFTVVIMHHTPFALSIVFLEKLKKIFDNIKIPCYDMKCGGDYMVSYKPLWYTLLSHDLKKSDLVKRGIVSSATMAKMGKNEYVALEVIDRICQELDCPIEEVLKIEKAPDA